MDFGNLRFELSNETYLIVLGFPIITMICYLLISYFVGIKIRSVKDFFLGNSEIDSTGLNATYVTSNVTFTNILIALAAFGYIEGIKTFWILFWWIAGVIFFIKKYPKLSSFFQDGGETLHEFLGQNYNSVKVRRYASLITVIVFLLTISLEIYGASYILNKIGITLGGSYLFTSLLIATIIMLYTYFGGFKAVIATDKFQFIVIGISLFLIGWATYSFSQNNEVSLQNYQINLQSIFDPVWILSMLVLFFPFQFVVMDMWQRIAAVKGNEKKVKKAILWSTPSFIIAFSLPIITGIIVFLSGTKLDSKFDALFVPLSAIQSQPILIGLLLSGFFAAILSTADTLLICASHSFVHDFWKTKNTFNGDENKELGSVKSWVLILGSVSGLFILLFHFFDLYNLIIAVFSAQVVFFIPILHAIKKKKDGVSKPKGILSSLFVGFITPFIVVIIGTIVNDRLIVDAAPIIAFVLSAIAFYSLKK